MSHRRNDDTTVAGHYFEVVAAVVVAFVLLIDRDPVDFSDHPASWPRMLTEEGDLLWKTEVTMLSENNPLFHEPYYRGRTFLESDVPVKQCCNDEQRTVLMVFNVQCSVSLCINSSRISYRYNSIP